MLSNRAKSAAFSSFAKEAMRGRQLFLSRRAVVSQCKSSFESTRRPSFQQTTTGRSIRTLIRTRVSDPILQNPTWKNSRRFKQSSSSKESAQSPDTKEEVIPVNPELADFVRLPDDTEQHIDSGFTVSFLGTGSGQISVHRGNSATALRMGSQTFLFDAGEGVQRQLMLSKIRMGDIVKIFITHMHGDHIFGLPGLLLRLQTIAKPGKGTKVVQVYGPVGIHNFIANSLSLSCTELRFLRVEVFELQGGSRRWRHPGASRTYQEYRHRGIERRAVPQNLDGTWTLLSVNEITSPDQAEKMSTHFHGVNVRAAEVEHTPKVHCFGFVVEEPQRQPASIDKDRAIAAGVRPGEKYRLLKLGFPVMSDDGSREVQPSEVLIGEAAQPRKLALLGDCCRVPPPMQQLCRNADLLVHEATLSEHDTGQKVDHGGHATALEAGQLANAVDAKVLALTHLPPTIRSNSSVKDVVREAQKGIRGRTRVQVAFDFMEIQIPRSGFSFSQRATLMKAKQDEDNDLTEAAEKE